MTKDEIVTELKKINSIWEMSDEELMKSRKFISKRDLSTESRHPFLAGVVQSEIDILIEKIKGGK